jgi:hypothetical protein
VLTSEYLNTLHSLCFISYIGMSCSVKTLLYYTLTLCLSSHVIGSFLYKVETYIHQNFKGRFLYNFFFCFSTFQLSAILSLFSGMLHELNVLPFVFYFILTSHKVHKYAPE